MSKPWSVLRTSGLITFSLLAVLFLAGCSPITKAEQPVVLEAQPLVEDASLGQTFTARFDGLSGVEVYLEPAGGNAGTIHLILRSEPGGEIIARSQLSLDRVTAPGFYHFPLPVQANANRQSYYLTLKIEGSGKVRVGASPGGDYQDGARYIRHQPDPQHQLAFKLSYAPKRLALGMLGEILVWSGTLLAAVWLFVLPGWGLLALTFSKSTRPFTQWDWMLKLAVSIGVSLAIYPVLMVLTKAVRLPLGILYVVLPPVLGLAAIIWSVRKAPSHPIRLRTMTWPGITLTALILILFASRFWIIRTLPAPLWGDSYQHALITQLMLENGGLFSSWAPYIPYTTFTTHFGFSAFAALLSWLTRLDSVLSTLWIGQVVNAFAVLTLYPLAVKMSKGNPWAGVGAVAFGGLISIQPAFYLNWGRYAQLAGQAILPVAFWLLWEALDQAPRFRRTDGPVLALAGAALAGLALSYYRMPFWYATLVLALLICWGLPKFRLNLHAWGHTLLRLLITGVVSLLLFLPWGLTLFGGNLTGAVSAGITGDAPAVRVLSDFNQLLQSSSSLPVWTFPLTAIIILIAVIRRRWMILALPVWYILLFGYRAGEIINLPGANMLQVFSVLISIYIPLSIGIGWLFSEFMSLAEARSNILVGVLSVFLVLLGGVLGWQQRLLLNRPAYELVTYADQRAFDWIEANLSQDAQVLVQGFPYHTTVAGSDAGWWLPLFTQRQNTIPPQYAQFNEVPQPPDFTAQLVENYTDLAALGLNQPESISLLCAWGITHIYHGQGQGQVGSPGPLFTPGELNGAGASYTRVYHEDRISIYALDPGSCGHD